MMADEQQERLEKLEEENVQLQLELEALNKRGQDYEEQIELLNKNIKEQKETIDNLINEMQSAMFAPSPDSTQSSDTSDTDGSAGAQPGDSLEVDLEMQEMERLLTVTLEERDRLQEEISLLRKDLEIAELQTLPDDRGMSGVESHESSAPTQPVDDSLLKKIQEAEEFEKILEMTLEEKDQLQDELEAAQAEISRLKELTGGVAPQPVESSPEFSITVAANPGIGYASVTPDHLRKETEEMEKLLLVTMEERDELQAKLEEAERKIERLSVQDSVPEVRALPGDADGEEAPAGDDKIEEIRALKRQVETLKQTVKSIAAKRVEPDAGDSAEQAVDEEALKELRLLREEVEGHRASIQQAQQQHMADQEEISRLHAEMEILHTEGQEHSSSHESLLEELRRIREELQSSQESHNALESDLVERDARIKEGETLHHAQTEQLADMKVAHEKARKELEMEYQQKLNDLRSALDSQGSASETEKADRVLLVANLDEAHRRLGELENERQVSLEHGAALKHELEKLKRDQETLLQQHERDLIAVDDLTLRASILQKELAVLHDRHGDEIEEVSADLNLRIAEQEQLISDKEKELLETHRNCAALEQERNHLKESVTVLREELSESKEQAGQKEDEFFSEMAQRETELQQRIQELERSLEESSEEAKVSGARYADFRREAEEKDSRIASLENSLRSITDEGSTLNTTLAQLKEELTAAQTEIETQQQALMKNSEEIEALNATIEKYERDALVKDSELKNISDAMNMAVDEERAKMQQKIQEFDVKERELLIQIEDLTAKKERQNLDFDEIRREKDTAGVDVARLQAIIDELNNRLEESNSKDEQIDSLMEKLDATQQELLGEREQWEEERRLFREKVQHSEAMMQAELTTREQQNLALVNENEARMSKIGDLQAEIRDLKQELEKAGSSLSTPSASTSNADTSGEVLALRSKVQELTEMVESIKQRAREMKAFYENKVATLEEMNVPPAELTGYTVDTSIVKRENDQLRQKIFDLENAMQAKNDQIAHLRGELYDLQDKGSSSAQSLESASTAGLMEREFESQIQELTRKIGEHEARLASQDAVIKRMDWQKANRDSGISTALSKLRKIRNELEALAKRKTKELIGQEFDDLENFIRKI